MDDVKSVEDGDAGAGMMGTVEFNSAILYRFATINVDALCTSLGDRTSTVEAVRQFLESFVRSMPTGKLNTFANRTLPEVVVVAICDDQPVSWHRDLRPQPYSARQRDSTENTNGLLRQHLPKDTDLRLLSREQL